MKILIGTFIVILSILASVTTYAAYPQSYFFGPAAVNSNVSNVCTASHGSYALRVDQQYVAPGFHSTSMWGCEPSRSFTLNYNPKYKLYFSMTNNDGFGTKVATCALQFPNTPEQLTKIQFVFGVII